MNDGVGNVAKVEAYEAETLMNAHLTNPSNTHILSKHEQTTFDLFYLEFFQRLRPPSRTPRPTASGNKAAPPLLESSSSLRWNLQHDLDHR